METIIKGFEDLANQEDASPDTTPLEAVSNTGGFDLSKVWTPTTANNMKTNESKNGAITSKNELAESQADPSEL